MFASQQFLQLKREVWEHRFAFFLTPLVGIVLPIIVAIYIFYYGPLLILNGAINIHIDNSYIKDFIVPANEPNYPYFHFHKENAFSFFASVACGISIASYFFIYFICAVNYGFGSLFSDRKSREILFWRSLPVSEAQNIGGKLMVLCIFLPLLMTLASLLVWCVLVVGGAAYAGDLKLVGYWLLENKGSSLPWFLLSFLFALLILPFTCWSLFMSALVRHHPGVLGILLPALLIVVDLLLKRYMGIELGIRSAISSYLDSLSTYMGGLDEKSIIRWFELDGEFWWLMLISLSVSLTFLAATLWLRNNRYEI